MNGVHDCGGMHGLGPIEVEQNEPTFRGDWERRVFAMFVLTSAAGHFNGDQFRFGMEKMAPAHYLTSTYYEHWLHSLEGLFADRGLLSEAEIDARMSELEQEHA